MKKITILTLSILMSVFTSFSQQQTVDFEELEFENEQNFWNGDDESGGFQTNDLFFTNDYNPDWMSWSGFAYTKDTDTHTAGWENQYSVYAPVKFWNGNDGNGGFNIGTIFFNNEYNFDWYSWSGFAYSKETDNETPGWENQYSAITGSGVEDNESYIIYYGNGIIEFENSNLVNSIQVTNSTYAYLSMLYGDDFSAQFQQDDWFKLTIFGWDENDEQIDEVVEFYLADFTDENPDNHYIVNTWEDIDLSSLGEVKKLSFLLESTDNGDWGMNTPAYFAIGGISVEDNDFNFEPVFDEYLHFPSTGNNGSEKYAVWFMDGEIIFNNTSTVNSISVANTTYAYLSMKHGDDFARKFEQDDWFKLTVFGYNENEEQIDEVVEFYLADFTDENPDNHYILDNWETIDLSSLGEVKKLSFLLESTDNGDWGMNTPNYFAIDDIVYSTVMSEIESASTSSKLISSIFPNPTSDFINIIGENGIITITDTNGRIIKTLSHNNMTNINLQDLSKGIYYVTLTSENTTQTENIILK
jgi:hypothetical protein